MAKHEKGHRFLSESSSSSRSRSRSYNRKRSSSRDGSKKRHKKHHHDKRKNDRSRKHRDPSSSSSKSSSRSRDHRRGKPRNKKQERENRRREEEREGNYSKLVDSVDARFKYPEAPKEEKPEEPPIEVEKPCFIRSGILAEYSNNLNGVTLKFTEPLDAKKPDENWRIFPFKGDEELPIIHLTKQSVYLFGKDPDVADILIEHPTCSGQHAVIQFREVKGKDNKGQNFSVIKPYLMDLESKNGTFLNSEKIEPARYYELLPEDVIKFAMSSRDYVVMKDE